MNETRNKITEDQAGCWLDGHMGWHNLYRVVDIAEEYGFTLSEDDRSSVACYRACGESGAGMHGDCADAVYEISDDATEYLNTLAPEGYHFEWDAGELMLWKGEPEDWES